MIDFDFSILYWIQEYIVAPWLTPIMKAVTTAGNAGMIWILLCLGLMLFKKTRWMGMTAAASLALVAIFNNEIIKPLVGRERPFTHTEIELLINAPHGYSFPSGHASSSFAVATAIFLSEKRFGIAAYILAFLIAFSRLYFFVHFPTDVFIGAIEGILFALAVVKIGDYAKKKFPSTLGKL